jgi:hypothetical protein
LSFTEDLLSIIRQQRHLASRVLIATQEPTLSPKLIDLCNVTIVHRFLSPAWFETLKKHLAGASAVGAKESSSVADIFRTIVGLQTGEALLFSPTALLDVGARDQTNPFAKPTVEQLKDSYIKLHIRKRVTADGGKSVMASDLVPASVSKSQSESESESSSVVPSAAPITDSESFYPSLSRFGRPAVAKGLPQPQSVSQHQSPKRQEQIQKPQPIKQPPQHAVPQPRQLGLNSLVPRSWPPRR